MIELPLDDDDPRHGMGDRQSGLTHGGSCREYTKVPAGESKLNLTRDVEDTASVGPEQRERRRILRDQLIVALAPGIASSLVSNSQWDVTDVEAVQKKLIGAATDLAERVYPRRP